MSSKIGKILLQVIRNLKVTDVSIEKVLSSFSLPPSAELGDIASNISFQLTKQLKVPPLKIAEQIKSLALPLIQEDPMINKIEAVPPGFLNIFYSPSVYVKTVLKEVLSEGKDYGSAIPKTPQKLIIEHTAINPCKPLHIGHLRNAILGDTMGRIYRFLGWNVEIQNLIDDLGKQVATLIWGLESSLDTTIPKPASMKYDLWLGQVYSIAATKIAETPELEAEVDSLMARAKHDNILYNKIRNLAEQCVSSNLETVSRLSIKYDLLVWESDISRSGVWEDTLKILEDNPSFQWISDGDKKGCFVAKLAHLPEFAKESDPDKILVRSNGVPTYNAHDIALQMWKFGRSQADLQFKPWPNHEKLPNLWTSTPSGGTVTHRFGHAQRVINVIGYEQNYLQRVLKTTFRLLNLDKEFNNSVHLSYKHVRLPGERFSGRTGNWFETRAWADAVIEDVKSIALQYLKEKRSDLELQVQGKIAEAITIGTIRYWLLKFNTEQTIIFDREKASRLDGDAGPFLMYSFVRAQRILQKARVAKIKIPKIETLPEDMDISAESYELAKTLASFGAIIKQTALQYQPNLLTSYVYSLATRFNKFYSKCPVLTTKGPQQSFRLLLVQAARQVLENGFKLLGIPLITEM